MAVSHRQPAPCKPPPAPACCLYLGNTRCSGLSSCFFFIYIYFFSPANNSRDSEIEIWIYWYALPRVSGVLLLDLGLGIAVESRNCPPATCITHCKGPSPDGKICLVPATCRNLAIRKSIRNTCRPSQFQRTGRER